MKLGYLIVTHTVDKPLIQLIRTLAKKEDYVFVFINDEKDRNEAYYKFSTNQFVHIETELPYATEGDLSLPRYYIHMMKAAIERHLEIKYFITLDPNMCPAQSKQTIDQHLLSHYPTNFYTPFVSKIDSKYFNSYFPFTNLMNFSKSKTTRFLSKATATITHSLGIKRKLSFDIVACSQYFIVSDQGAQALVDNIEFLTDHFKLSWYPEQIGLGTMFYQFLKQTHQSAPFYIGPMNEENLFTTAKEITDLSQIDDKHLFIGTITDENLYKNYLMNY